jgi:hypothetical protein
MSALTYGAIRDVRADDSRTIERVAQLHVELLSFGPLAAFGPRLVREFGYRLPMHVGLLQLSVYEAEGEIGGFIAITADPESLHKNAVGRHWPQLILLMGASLVESPRRLHDLARAVRIWRSRAPEPEGGPVGLGEVAAIAVRPEFAGIQFVRDHRVRVSEALLDHAIAAFRRQHLSRMRGLLDADNPAPQLLYGRRGARFRHFTQAGVPMVEATLDLRQA